ncbi:MAG: hypothetical protein WCL14_00540 [Bacteroidota bacterium]
MKDKISIWEIDNLIWVFIFLGIVLRLIWLPDMEWKGDEQWMFEHSQQSVHGGQFPLVGMESSGGIVNPGLSVWIFSAMSFVCSTPVGMARGVAMINVISILGFVLFVMKKVGEKERMIWLWGLALASVSPLAVLFSRKIWEQDVIVLFSMLTIVGNAYRAKRSGAFVWGLAGAMVGQIHMSGFFYALGLVVFTVVHDLTSKQRTQWIWWFIGSVIGGVGLIPWVLFISGHPHPTTLAWSHLLQFSFYFYWIIDGLGLNIMYSIRKTFWEFIKWPYIGEMPTYLLGLIHVFLAAVGLFSIKKIYFHVKNNSKNFKSWESIKGYIAKVNMNEFYLLSILLGLGVFMNFSGVMTFQHYMIVAFPFSYIFIVKILFKNKKLLLALISAQMIITISFLVYVHMHDGIEKGDYGKSWISQQNSKPVEHDYK